jgi:hypothetical protein
MIRSAAVFSFLGLALAAAAVDPDDRGGVNAGLETGHAPVPKDGGVAGAEGSVGPHQRANPLWTIPLSALTATRDRPLFSLWRRPPPLAVEAAAPPPPAPDPAPSAPAQPERPALKLIGTIVSPSTSVAMLRDTATQAVTRLREGEVTSGWLLKAVKLRSVIVEKNEQSAILALPDRLDTSGEQPSPNPLAFGDRRNKH